LGLTRALEAMIDKAGLSSGVVFKYKLDNADDLFPKDAAMNLYRIVQESLNNILKHSRAGNASITLERDVHEIQLTISDDGHGFNVEKNGKGMGLKNIAERVRILGGKLKMDSQPNNGTRIEITIPISAEAE
jgi:signal transduction histidine kinase